MRKRGDKKGKKDERHKPPQHWLKSWRDVTGVSVTGIHKGRELRRPCRFEQLMRVRGRFGSRSGDERQETSGLDPGARLVERIMQVEAFGREGRTIPDLKDNAVFLSLAPADCALDGASIPGRAAKRMEGNAMIAVV
jgi:hypothetical protein